ncbi:uncharacterized protein LOC129240967 isoform X1 [Anastrepha obliqua]|uniref:uncharacterized protein LOC129240967 isoform X1 n=2 Tax=Anastrepha obliqua TaxID=95512 RepID=UPI002409A30A|nr:uncharacterized protein LOC129240967 isoform X1 [Anastrepha obliqua]XP_054733026.1 uncharacterized protein LOC129240967 isoform X1 [Anastrepha obliqua]XP_054733027.1 uncharacterized protein LOC129240967 isoform X1 [Anastrepha obliqua]XP_054733028.1 uncharacterized protein LOC129240967 isoform X1 [Anastrepha obliqua]XP_054733029.1 uncharacterized protein LOC129240967 isoform X1 [Anastrepha obliqua]XP_054733030.1 uncharacterized protein LOC129240967 isoform X1 [Anastrepha obliqua]XP_05473303
MSYLRSVEISRVEMTPAEDSTYTTSTGSKRASYSLIGIKVLELALVIVCIGLIDEPSTHSHLRVFITPRVVALCYVTFGSLLIYSSIYLIMALFGDITPWRTATLWSFVGFILLIVTTALLFRDWSTTKERNYWHPNMQRLDLVLGAASVALVSTLIYLVDLLATIRFGISGELE